MKYIKIRYFLINIAITFFVLCFYKETYSNFFYNTPRTILEVCFSALLIFSSVLFLFDNLFFYRMKNEIKVRLQHQYFMYCMLKIIELSIIKISSSTVIYLIFNLSSIKFLIIDVVTIMVFSFVFIIFKKLSVEIKIVACVLVVYFIKYFIVFLS